MRISYWSSDVCSSDLPRDRLVPRATDSSHKDEAMPAAPEIAPRIRDSFARQSFMTSIGAEITLIGDGRVGVDAPVGSAFLQQQGFAHGTSEEGREGKEGGSTGKYGGWPENKKK